MFSPKILLSIILLNADQRPVLTVNCQQFGNINSKNSIRNFWFSRDKEQTHKNKVILLWLHHFLPGHTFSV